MTPQNAIHLADRVSRKRAIGTSVATVVFLALQVVTRPVFLETGVPAPGPRAYMWAINAAVLLLLLLPIGGFIFGERVRALVNDDVSRHNARTASATGFWVAMAIGLGIYALPAGRGLTGMEASYLLVTATVAVALLSFSWLEARALRDG